MKKFCNSVKIWQHYGHESVAPFFSPTLYSYPKDSDVINTSTYNDSLQAATVFRPPHLSIADVL